jgi:hypothetical protein
VTTHCADDPERAGRAPGGRAPAPRCRLAALRRLLQKGGLQLTPARRATLLCRPIPASLPFSGLRGGAELRGRGFGHGLHLGQALFEITAKHFVAAHEELHGFGDEVVPAHHKP